MISCSSKLAFVSQNDDNLERRESANLRYTQSAVEVDMASGKVMRIPNTAIKQPEINITEVRSGMSQENTGGDVTICDT